MEMNHSQIAGKLNIYKFASSKILIEGPFYKWLVKQDSVVTISLTVKETLEVIILIVPLTNVTVEFISYYRSNIAK